jgi:tetratricopeptide (TPR) repeat protein
MLRTEIGQASSLRTISSDRLHQLLRDLRIAPDASFDPPTLRRVAEFGNADTVLWGQYIKIANEIRIDATLQDVRRDRSIPLKAEAVNEQALIGAIGQLAQSVRDNLELSSDAVAELKATAFKPSTSSVEALRAYNEGLALARQNKQSDALKRFEAATTADAAFALAYSKAGLAYSALGYDTEAELSSRKAVDLSERLPPQERYVIQATHARVTNDLDKAIESYEQLAKIAPDDPDVNFALAGLYEEKGTFDRAREGYARILELDPKNAGALLALGRIEIRRGDRQAALNPLNQALTLAVEFDNQEQKADINHAIGVAYRLLSKPQEALRYHEEALAIRKQLDLKRGLAVSLGEIAHVQKDLGRPKEALAAYTESLAIQREIGDQQGTGMTLYYLGGFYEDMSEYDRALQYYRETLQIQRDLGNDNMQATLLNTIGNIYLFKTQYDDAMTYFERALPIREKAGVAGPTADVLHNLGETSTNLGRYDDALAHYLRALELRRKEGDARGEAIESYSIGTLFEYQGRFGAAVKSKEEALASFRTLKEQSFWLAEILSGYGNALSQIGRTSDATKILDEAMALARSLDNTALVAQILNFQGDARYYAGDIRGARTVFEQAAKEAARTSDQRLVLLSRANIAKVDLKEGRAQPAAASLRSVAADADSRGLKYLSVQSAALMGDALLAAKNYTAARTELERARLNSEKLGLRALQAQIHHLLAATYRSTNNAADASRHANQARRLLQEIQKEAGTDTVSKRADLAPILTDAG